MEEGERLLRHAGSDTAGVEQPAIVVVKGEQQGAQEGPRPFRVRPADDDEFAAIEALGFDPGAAVVGEIAAIDALGDDAFEAMSAGGAAERLAVAGFMGAECDSVRRLLEEGREACLAVEERQGGEVFPVEIEEIEDEINEVGAAAIGGLLHELEGGHAVRANAAEFAVKIGGFDLKRRERGGGGRILGGPVEPGTGK
ncbi:MAG TPA: hypothetical protein VJY34_17330 [Roseiarcus sp.]|nr:hypothetical protein [Roseiarcus sp.]